jgi:hypothetical protein
MISPSDAAPYYRAALRALRFLEQRRPTGRRFGSEADARWTALRGDLAIADRIDLLIRDANAEWPGALGARAVFHVNDVAEDDPFGAQWTPLDPVDGEEIWRAVLAEPPPGTLGAALDAVALAWSMTLTPFSVGAIQPSDRLVVAGPSAIASTLAAFAESTDLVWHRQVVVVATAPGPRQLAALAPAWLNVNEAVHVLIADEAPPKLDVRRAVVSDEASDDDRRWAQALGSRG